MGVMICLSQGGLRSLSASSFILFDLSLLPHIIQPIYTSLASYIKKKHEKEKKKKRKTPPAPTPPP